MTLKKNNQQSLLIAGRPTIFVCDKDLFLNRIVPAIKLIDALHVSLTGVSHLDLRVHVNTGGLETPVAAETSMSVSSGPEVAAFLRRVHEIYLTDVSDHKAKRFKVGEAGPIPLHQLPDILFALAGGLMMIRPVADPAIDRSILNGGQNEVPIHFGRRPSGGYQGVGVDGFTNASNNTKSYRCIVSIPRAAARLDRLRAVLGGDSFDGLSYRDKKGSPLIVGNRIVMIISVSSPDVTPRRIYEALARSGAVDGEEIYNGLTHVDPFAPRINPDMAFHIFVPGVAAGHWRLFGSTSERKLARAIIDV